MQCTVCVLSRHTRGNEQWRTWAAPYVYPFPCSSNGAVPGPHWRNRVPCLEMQLGLWSSWWGSQVWEPQWGGSLSTAQPWRHLRMMLHIATLSCWLLALFPLRLASRADGSYSCTKMKSFESPKLWSVLLVFLCDLNAGLYCCFLLQCWASRSGQSCSQHLAMVLCVGIDFNCDTKNVCA